MCRMLESAPVTGRAAGRHRVPPRRSPGRPPSLLFMDYPASDGPLAGYQVRTFAPATGRRPGLRPPGRRSGLRPVIRSVGRDGAMAVAVTCLAAAVLVGIALSHSPGAAVGGNAVPGLPQPGSLLPQPSAISPSPATSPDRAHRSAGPGRRTATMQAQLKPVIQTRPSAADRQHAARPPAVVVRYLVASQGPGGFQGEIQVTNNTAQPIGNWQIVVTLYDDAVTSFTNADGFFSNGILLLSPANPAQVAPPDGGVLDVFFTAHGFQTIPAVCAFDGISCG
jgi:hypothetical protein